MHAPSENQPFTIRIPEDVGGCDQTDEWFLLEMQGSTRRLRIQDYPAVYRVPGLYETVVYDTLKCSSHKRFADLLRCALTERGQSGRNLSILELGAGNGVVGEKLKSLGIGKLTGLDLLAEAREAALRDRPGVYDRYIVADLVKDDPLAGENFDGLVVVSALGDGGIPPSAFLRAAARIPTGGLIGLTFKSEFLDSDNAHEFGVLLRALLNDGSLELEALQRYRHRYSIAGKSISYTALIAKKAQTLSQLHPLSDPDTSVDGCISAIYQGVA